MFEKKFLSNFFSLYNNIKVYLHWNWCQMIYSYHCWLSGIALSPSGLYGGDCFAILSRFVGNLWSKNDKHNSINLMATRQFCAFSIFTFSTKIFHIKIKLMRLCRIEEKWDERLRRNFHWTWAKRKTKMRTKRDVNFDSMSFPKHSWLKCDFCCGKFWRVWRSRQNIELKIL